MRSVHLAVALTLAGCGATQQYAPPLHPGPADEMSVVVEATFDATWSKLIELLGSSFYSIELLDKDSGFIRLGFTAADPEEYVDCGDITVNPAPWSGAQSYSGPYARYLMIENGFDLQARVNVVVKALGEERTSVRVHSRYIFGRYVFETATQHTQTTWLRIAEREEKRTCQPTHLAEKLFLTWVQPE